MSRFVSLLSFVFAACLVSTLASAGTPRADGPVEQHDAPPALFADFDRLQRGKLHFDFGPVDYRLAREGLNFSYRASGTATRAIVGYSGGRRLEIGWRLRRANVTVAIGEEDQRSGYRIKLSREF